MTLKSQIDYQCPQCLRPWLPFRKGVACPACGRAVPDEEITGIVPEALESARFNKRLYGRFELEHWMTRRLGDRYFAWGFRALQLAENAPQQDAKTLAVAALMDLNLEEMAPLREHVVEFLQALIERYRAAIAVHPEEWQKMPEPEKPFFGRKIIEDQ